MSGTYKLVAAVAGFVLLTAFATILTSYWGVSVSIVVPPAIQPRAFESNINDPFGPLLTPTERRWLLYNEADNKSTDPGRMSDSRYVNMIRSLMTRPDPSRPPQLKLKSKPNAGRNHFSEGGQSTLIDQRLRGRRNGFFIECGAHDGEYNSNSLFFELERNWTGLLIEPDPTAYRKLLAKNRKAYVFTGCLSPSGRSQQSMFMAAGIYGGIKDKIPQRFLDVISEKHISFTVIPAMCFPLNDILDVIGVNHIDYLSLDIEGPELQILETIDWNRVRIDILTIEIHPDKKKLEDSRQLMKRIGGYREVGLQGYDVVYERTDLQ